MELLAVFLALGATTYAHSWAKPPFQFPLTLSYNSFEDGKVVSASTVYTSAAPTKSCSVSGVTSYSVDPADLVYPTFTTAPSALASNPAAPGLMNASDFAKEAVELVFKFKTANSTNCEQCQQVFEGLVASMKVAQETLANIAVPFCQAISLFVPTEICTGLFNIASTDLGGVFPALDIMGEDGQTLCAFMFGVCTLPPVPKRDYHYLFKNTTKPPPKVLQPPPYKKEPLKVFHISDYHLDLRYVVGSEANCTSSALGSVCCRVFPYTNVSVPITQPASLFGNYECDTPEALATSVFRAVPSVTGIEWEDFAFGLFTGDLVSHDLWELTKPYVIAEELASYQQFFDGLGGLTMYPTLGNHDTFPHAFAAFPNQDDVLPKNASYDIQERYNYKAVADAWENYGWITPKQAQSAITSGLGIYRSMTKEGLTIISLNSDAWYYFNFYAYIGANRPDHTGMFSTLIDWLLEAEKNDQPVWLIQHVNIGGSSDYESLPAPSDLYYQIVDRFSATIRGTFFGHTHADEFGVFYTNNATVRSAEAAVAIGWIMPSVTPYTNYNAGFRYYLVDPDTFMVMDSLTYYANISDTPAWEKTGIVEWQFEYSARDTYDYNKTLKWDEPLSPAFWHGVAVDIMKNTTTQERYTDLRSKLYRPFTPVTGTSLNHTLCGLVSMSVPVFADCVHSPDSLSVLL